MIDPPHTTSAMPLGLGWLPSVTTPSVAGGLGGYPWPPPPAPDGGVREPLRSSPSSGSGNAVLPIPLEVTHACD